MENKIEFVLKPVTGAADLRQRVRETGDLPRVPQRKVQCERNRRADKRKPCQQVFHVLY